jgi:cytoskeletal protein CcmA (bactofilin family)
MWKRDALPLPKPATMPTQSASEQTQPITVLARPVEKPPVEAVVMNLGQSMRIKGELSASEDMTLCGHMEGRVTLTDHTLTIGPEADIRAEIKASTVVIMGVVLGNVTASHKIDLRSTGSVTGDIAAPRIVIADGGQLLGKVQITGEKTLETRRTA